MPRRGVNIYKHKDGRLEAKYVKEITFLARKSMALFINEYTTNSQERIFY